MENSTSDGRKFSVVIPYKNRLETLAIVFAALAEQTMDRVRDAVKLRYA